MIEVVFVGMLRCSRGGENHSVTNLKIIFVLLAVFEKISGTIVFRDFAGSFLRLVQRQFHLGYSDYISADGGAHREGRKCR